MHIVGVRMQPSPPYSPSATISPDGLWLWDGRRWVPTAPVAPPRPSLESPRLRAELAGASLLILVAVNLLDIVNSALDLTVFGGHLGPGIRGTHFLWSEARNALVGVSWLLIAFPASVITISVWVYRAYRN